MRPYQISDFIFDHLVWFVVGFFVLIGVIFAIAAPSYYSESTKSDCVVDSKDRTRDQNGTSDARIYTENCGTLTVSDSLVKGQFDSGDVYGSISEGDTYDFTVYGPRVPILSMFPNIIEVREAG